MSAAKINPGEYYVTDKIELITTVIGSCIAVIVYDSKKNIGGMNHFAIPSSVQSYTPSTGKSLDTLLIYGIKMMDELVASVLHNGGDRSNLIFKIFGCASIEDTDPSISERNLAFIDRYMTQTNVNLQAYDVRGSQPRKIVYFPESGQVMVKLLHELPNETLLTRERDYFLKLDNMGMIDVTH